ncbi:MAG: hypothetical protein JST54_35200 [Deltaproteobacteria bacterium]|nr:hypothetical protein [Deltaproteobacteria bacterium]
MRGLDGSPQDATPSVAVESRRADVSVPAHVTESNADRPLTEREYLLLSPRGIVSHLPWLGSIAFSIVFIWRTRFAIAGETYFSLVDDAMISMTYARNLAQGHGLLWMAGGHHVEGYTNLLWTLWMSLVHLFPIPDSKTSLFVSISSALLLATNVGVAGRIAETLTTDWRAGLVSRVLVAAYFPLIYWSLRGMEVGLLATIVGTLTLFALQLEQKFDVRKRNIFAAVMAAGLLVRPDGLIPCAIGAAFVVVFSPRSERLRTAIMLLVVGVFVVAGVEVFRKTYYGDWLPNTYYLKMTGVTVWFRVSRGLSVFGDAASSYLLPPIALAVAAVWRRIDRRTLVLLTLAASYIFYSVWVGGDSWEQTGYTNRFITSAIDPLLVLAALGALRIADLALNPSIVGQRPIATSLLISCVLVWASCQSMYRTWMDRDKFDAHLDAEAVAFGYILREATPATSTVAVAWAGAIPYFSHRLSIDLLGKNDTEVAHSRPHPMATFWPGHNKWDYSHSIGELRPDFVQALWNPTNDDFQQMSRLGYYSLKNGIWFSQAMSNRANLDVLSRTPAEVLTNAP